MPVALYLEYWDFGSDVALKEKFVSIEPVKDSTEKWLAAKIESILIREELNLGNCRGQDYNNVANM